MLSKNEVIVRYLICLVLFFLSGSEMITGWPATLCGVIGTIELATALLQYSPLHERSNSLQHEIKTYASNFSLPGFAHHN